ncbi:MAG: FkbM family methyltransferase [Cocleimonas sp.]
MKNNNKVHTSLPKKQVNLHNIKESWVLGEWQELATIDLTTISTHKNKKELILYVLNAFQQLGNNNKTYECIHLAQKFGCTKNEVINALLSVIQNNLGRLSLLYKDKIKIKHFFDAALGVTNDGEFNATSHKRTVQECIKLGLLPQSIELTRHQSAKLKKEGKLNQARLSIFENELILLQQELILAQQRNQLYINSSNQKNRDKLSWLEQLAQLSVSQLKQDLWVLKKNNYKRNGFFVEFGATNGVLLSNTHLLEKEFDWKGICAEPNPIFYKELKENRSCITSDACIGSTTGEKVEFIFADVYGGMTKHKNDDKHGGIREAYETSGKTNTLTTISLNDFLLESNAPRNIDYISIDTEGSEYEILKTFPFNEWKVKLLTIEHNFTANRQKIQTLLESYGYKCTEQKWDDWFELSTQ